MSRQSSVRCKQRMSKMDKICFSTVEYILSHEHLFRWKFSLYDSFDSRNQKGKTTWGGHPSEFSYIFRRVRGFCQFGTAGRAYHFSSSHLCLLSKQPLRRVFWPNYFSYQCLSEGFTLELAILCLCCLIVNIYLGLLVFSLRSNLTLLPDRFSS